MSLTFKSFIKIKFLLVIFVPTFLLFFGIIIYMPKDKNILSDKEIISVLSYIKSTWPNKVKKIHDQINDRKKSK